MKPILRLLLFLLCATAVHAQDPDLTVTLPSGKVVTFETAEQKEKFLAARARAQQSSSGPATAPSTTTGTTATTTSPSSSSSTMGHTALDEKPTGTGRVNVNAPVFTTDYYMLDPESWVGKQLTLSVAYLSNHNAALQRDDMLQFTAYTWGRTHYQSEQLPGGTMTILATPTAAQRILSLCPHTLSTDATGVRMALIKGELTVLDTYKSGRKHYALIVRE